MNARIFIEKKTSYDIHTTNIAQKIKHICTPSSLKLYLIYDVFNVTPSALATLIKEVLADPHTDIVHSEHPHPNSKLQFAWECLPGQFDQRADAAEQCAYLLNIATKLKIKTAQLLILSDDAKPHVETIKQYLINAVDSQEKNLSILKMSGASPITKIPVFKTFNHLSTADLLQFIARHNFSINIDDALLIQQYFKGEKRNPNLAELKILDTYWSDHCRHTTFNTIIQSVTIKGQFKEVIEQALQSYYTLKKACGQSQKPLTLMHLATVIASYLKKEQILNNVEDSEEVNACSIKVDINTPKGKEKWLLMFKNETHNHPTEIDPYGGASTCVGGAIRDPLSGRAFVYQAMRISGSANPLAKNTIAHKLPQKKITQEAAQGFSAYGNQIGLATTLVKEFYHEGYKAKRMEVGMVVGAVAASYVKRQKPVPGDVVILLGGRTGKDGIGGASGSSKTIDVKKQTTDYSAEVQKGNAPLERKLQRLFRNPKFLALIKKCNDFGAGGVAVAVGELADGLNINLDTIPTKYRGLNAMELALSESQERMAVVCRKKDALRVYQLAQEENVEATIIADITKEKIVSMWSKGKEVVRLKRSFLNSNGATRKVAVQYDDTKQPNPFEEIPPFTQKNYILQLRSLKHAAQIGLINQFDSSIGKSTVLAPLGGKFQSTAEDVSAQLLPHPTTSTASVIAHGYNPYLSSWQTFHGAIFAVLEAVSKLVAAGMHLQDIRLSFQEYFPSLKNDPTRWGKPFGALLGAMYAQQALSIAAIGGKDSMSGSYDKIDVPPTLIAFGVGTLEMENVIPSTLVDTDSYIYLLKVDIDKNCIPVWKDVLKKYQILRNIQQRKTILAAKTIGEGGIAMAITAMTMGNRVGVSINYSSLFYPFYGSVILQSSKKLTSRYTTLIGKTNQQKKLVFNDDITLSIERAYQLLTRTLEPIFPNTLPAEKTTPNLSLVPSYFENRSHTFHIAKMKKPLICMPIFTGTNSEYDTAQSFDEAGAMSQTFVFRDQTPQEIKVSIQHFTKCLQKSQVLSLVGGFSYADEPDGAGKYIAILLKQKSVWESIQKLLERGGLILGICNGFQALIKSGLLPCNEPEATLSLTYNTIGRHIAVMSDIRIISNRSPWISKDEVGKIFTVPVSHGEGRMRVSQEWVEKLHANGQIISQYVHNGKASLDFPSNPNGSDYAIEGLCDASGQIFGKMAHVERVKEGLFKNIPHVEYHNIFKNAVRYFS